MDFDEYSSGPSEAGQNFEAVAPLEEAPDPPPIPDKLRQRFIAKNLHVVRGQFACRLCKALHARKDELEAHLVNVHGEELTAFALEKGLDSAGESFIHGRLKELARKEREHRANGASHAAVPSSSDLAAFSFDAVFAGKKREGSLWEETEAREKRRRLCEEQNIGMLRQHAMSKTDAMSLAEKDAAEGLDCAETDKQILDGLKSVFCKRNLLSLGRGGCRCTLCREKFGSKREGEEHCVTKHRKELAVEFERWERYTAAQTMDKQCPVCLDFYGELKRHLGKAVWISRDTAHVKGYATWKEEDEEDLDVD